MRLFKAFLAIILLEGLGYNQPLHAPVPDTGEITKIDTRPLSPDEQRKLIAQALAMLQYSAALTTANIMKRSITSGIAGATTTMLDAKRSYARTKAAVKEVCNEWQIASLPSQIGTALFTKGLHPIEKGDYELIVKQQTQVFITVLVPIVAVAIGILIAKFHAKVNQSKLTQLSALTIAGVLGVVTSYLSQTQFAITNLEELEQKGLIDLDFYQQKLAKTVLGAFMGYLLLRSAPESIRRSFLVQKAFHIIQGVLFALKLCGQI